MSTAKQRNDAHTNRWAELTEDKHIRAQAERLLPVLTLVKGTKDGPVLDDVIHSIVTGIMALEAYPDSKQTANNGGITVTRGPMDGYGIHLWVTDVYLLHMDSYSAAIKGFKGEAIA